MKTITFLFAAALLIGCNNADPAERFNSQFGNSQPHDLADGESFTPNRDDQQNTIGVADLGNQYQGEQETSGGQITLVDQGLGMPYATITVPQTWKLSQDIGTDLSTAKFAKFRVDLEGPNNAFSRSLGNMMYNNMYGQHAPDAWQYLLQRGMGDFSELQWGQMKQDTEAMNKPENQENIQKLKQRGLSSEKLITTFAGKFHGNAVTGLVEIAHFADRDFGFVGVLLFVAPANSDITAVRTAANAIWNTTQFNPAHDAAIGQIINGQTRQIDNNTAQMTRDHNQRMADQKQNFDAHQQKMNGIYESNDRQNAAWMNNQRGGTQGNTSSEYGNHEQFIDQQYERTTFTDEQTGFPVHQDGQHDYWYTNGDGKYYGTDDMNFDPQQLGNDWHQAEPRKP